MYAYYFSFRNVDELVEMVNVHPVYYIIAIVIMLVSIATLLLLSLICMFPGTKLALYYWQII